MLHSNSVTSSFGSELLALRAVLHSTINAIRGINWSDNPSAGRALQQEQFCELSQQLKYLNTIGLKLAARWNRAHLGEEQAAFIQPLAHQLLNLLSALSSAMDMLEQCGFKLDPVAFSRVEQAVDDFAQLLDETTDAQLYVKS